MSLLLVSLVVLNVISVTALSVLMVLLAVNYRRLPPRIPKLLDVDTVLIVPPSARTSLRTLTAAGDPQMSWGRWWLLFFTATFALDTVMLALLSWMTLRSGPVIVAEAGLMACALNALGGIGLIVYVAFQVRWALGGAARGPLVPKTFARLSPYALALGLACIAAYGFWAYGQLQAAQF